MKRIGLLILGITKNPLEHSWQIHMRRGNSVFFSGKECSTKVEIIVHGRYKQAVLGIRVINLRMADIRVYVSLSSFSTSPPDEEIEEFNSALKKRWLHYQQAT